MDPRYDLPGLEYEAKYVVDAVVIEGERPLFDRAALPAGEEERVTRRGEIRGGTGPGRLRPCCVRGGRAGGIEPSGFAGRAIAIDAEGGYAGATVPAVAASEGGPNRPI